LNLIKACSANGINIWTYKDDENLQKNFISILDKDYDMIVDGIFGFSFKGPLKPPYDKLFVDLKGIKTPIFSIDNPSGWEIEKGIENKVNKNCLGNVYDTFEPKYVISLTLPKICMKGFKGVHYVGGRFIPK